MTPGCRCSWQVASDHDRHWGDVEHVFAAWHGLMVDGTGPINGFRYDMDPKLETICAIYSETTVMQNHSNMQRLALLKEHISNQLF